MTSPTETEVKIPLTASPDEFSKRLEKAGYAISAPRVFESNTLYDSSDGSLRTRGVLMRLREVGEKGVITWKGVAVPGPYKVRPEIETSVGSTEKLAQILHELGLDPQFRYEKFRTEFRKPGGAGVVTVDETPIGNFLELEGPGDWIDEAAAELGFAVSDYVLESYGRLYQQYCERRGIEPTHMVFACAEP
ncbi:MAG: class IV adenylate cyclase [Acidobacteriaceae bacterium]|nr:class IV adenylate cyclase [Acidobacteriaceae bacterium]